MVKCAWASQDERKKLSGGKAGDQTGLEIKCGNIYNFGQTRVYRCKSRSKAELIGAAAKGIAINNRFGYCQSHRVSGYNALKSKNWVVSAVTENCELDCSEMAACAVNVAYKSALISSGVYSGNIGKALLATGLFVDVTENGKKTKYLGVSEYIECGDIIVAPGKHVIVAYTDGTKVSKNTVSTVVSGIISGNSLIRKGQQEAVKFTGVKIATDGIAGKDTNRMKARVLQRALNKDYNSQLVCDGIFGTASKKALGSHYVKKGEKQYMVTAAEILMLLNGFDPNGVEYPGTYGNGLVIASKAKFGDDGQKITANEFLKLI